MINSQIWENGLSIEEYVTQIEHFQKEMKERLRDLRITPSECQKLRDFQMHRKILVLTESWCGDSLMNLPIIAKMVECATNLELRVFIRSEHPELEEYFLGLQIEKIPIVWIMDDNFKPVGYWVERPKTAYKMITNWKKENPEYERLRLDKDLDPIEKKRQFAPYKARYIDEMWNWYDTGLQSETIKEVFKILQK